MDNITICMSMIKTQITFVNIEVPICLITKEYIYIVENKYHSIQTIVL